MSDRIAVLAAGKVHQIAAPREIYHRPATAFVARFIGLDNPRSAMAFGGLMGTVSGVTGGLAATDPKLVPYGALTSTFHTGIGCLVAPSVFYLTLRAIVGA